MVSRPAQEKNSAIRGSILNVWSGQFEYSKPAHFYCQIQSNKNISMFQSLQQWPKRLSLAGRAKSAEAIAYFQTNHKCKQLISGWLYQVPGEFCDNEHLNKNFRHFCNYLISEDKFGVCKPTPDNNITLYIFPIA
jgi:hypothetical protein